MRSGVSHPGPGAKMFVGEGRVPFQPGCSGSSRVAGRGHELKNVRASVGRQGPGRSLVTSEIACPRRRAKLPVHVLSQMRQSRRPVCLQVPPCILRLT